jgi:hypothetical protein
VPTLALAHRLASQGIARALAARFRQPLPPARTHRHAPHMSLCAGADAPPSKGSSSTTSKGPSKQGPIDAEFVTAFDGSVRIFFNGVLLIIGGAPVKSATALLEQPYPVKAAQEVVVNCNEAANRVIIDFELIAAVNALRQEDSAAVESLGIWLEHKVRGVSSADGELDYVFGRNNGGIVSGSHTAVYFEAKRRQAIDRDVLKTPQNLAWIHQVKCGMDALRGDDDRAMCQWGAVYDGAVLILCYTTQLEGSIHCDLIKDRAAILAAIIFLLYISVAPAGKQCLVKDPRRGLATALSDGSDGGDVCDDDFGSGDYNRGDSAETSSDNPAADESHSGRGNALCAPASPMILRESLLAKRATAFEPMDRVRAALKTLNF